MLRDSHRGSLSLRAGPGQGGVWLWLPLALQLCATRVGGVETLDRFQLDAAYRAQLESLAQKCDELGLAEQARTSRTWSPPRDPGRHYLFLPSAADPSRLPEDAPRLVQLWHARFSELRREQAERLFALARQYLDAGTEGRAYRLLHEALHEDPDHAQVRRILGYRRGERGWSRQSRTPQRRRTRGTHPQFGWASNQYWNVESDRFELTTNLSARAGQQAAAFLERVHDVWQQLFYEYWSVPGRLKERFQGEDKPLGPDRTFSVVLFRDRDEYVRQLVRSEPQIERSVGYYAHSHQTAFFYGGDDTAQTTWIHESTHQFFQESGVVAPRVGQQNNFWIVEGLALYMESLTDCDAYATTGGVDADRLQFARFRRLSERYYVPLSQLVGYGVEQLQKAADIRQLYSQCAGLSHFFMHGDKGRMMRPLIEYVQNVYRGAAEQASLASQLAASYAQLDQAYLAFLNVTDADLAFLDPGARHLCLGHTAVTDVGLEQVRGCKELRWLDLSFTATGDAGSAHFAGAGNVQQLNLEGTQISDRALDVVAGLRQLQELDLSQTGITDQGLAKLAGLGRLQILWLTRTQVTDEGLAALSSLRNLEQLDVQGTRVTPAALDQLRRRLPKLK